MVESVDSVSLKDCPCKDTAILSGGECDIIGAVPRGFAADAPPCGRRASLVSLFQYQRRCYEDMPK
jgi:hypothetical protein